VSRRIVGSFVLNLVILRLALWTLTGVWIVALIALIRADGVESLPIIAFLAATFALVAAVCSLISRLERRPSK